MRYGDDFILLGSSKAIEFEYRYEAQQFLENKLGLHLHKRNDVIVRGRDGLHFLGHKIYPRGIVVEPVTEQRLLTRLTLENAASYQALHLPRRLRKQLPWLIHENTEKILDLDHKMQ